MSFDLKLSERTGFCRGCDTKLVHGRDMVFHTYSLRNRGITVLICMECADEMFEKLEAHNATKS